MALYFSVSQIFVSGILFYMKYASWGIWVCLWACCACVCGFIVFQRKAFSLQILFSWTLNIAITFHNGQAIICIEKTFSYALAHRHKHTAHKGCISIEQTILNPPMIPKLCFPIRRYICGYSRFSLCLVTSIGGSFLGLGFIAATRVESIACFLQSVNRLSRCTRTIVTSLSGLSWWAVFAARSIHPTNWRLTNLWLCRLFTITKCFRIFWSFIDKYVFAVHCKTKMQIRTFVSTQLYIFSYQSIQIFLS